MNLAPQNQLALVLAIILTIGIFFVPQDLKTRYPGNKLQLLIIVVLGTLLYLTFFYFVGSSIIFKSVLILIFFISLVFILRISRDLLYLLSLFFLIVCPILLMFHFDAIARYSAAVSLVVLGIGLGRDLLNDKNSNN